MTTIEIINYKCLLDRLMLARPEPSHLLLGNGFNNSLGVRTSYREIFNRMKRRYRSYQKLEEFVEKKGYDIELLIEDLKKAVQPDDRSFLGPYIERKVKLDFMKATDEIVQEQIKYVYSEHNESIHLLLRNFTSYFTLNFDPLLYLVLLRLKKENRVNDAFAFHQAKLPIHQDLSETEREIYEQVKSARQGGEFQISSGEQFVAKGFRRETKGYFSDSLKRLYKPMFKQNKWSRKDVEKVINQVWIEEKIKRQEAQLTINDGFSPKNDYSCSSEQNLFYLHGAFHIIKKGKKLQKITQTQNKTFLRCLERAIHSENQKIISVFAGTTEDKANEIKNHTYLQKCLDELAKISGSLVILGSSLADNDQHIFDHINQSQVKNIYISCRVESGDRVSERAHKKFRGKYITLFDRETISFGNET